MGPELDDVGDFIQVLFIFAAELIVSAGVAKFQNLIIIFWRLHGASVDVVEIDLLEFGLFPLGGESEAFFLGVDIQEPFIPPAQVF